MKEHQAGYDRIAKAKTILVLDHPFYGTLAMNTPVTIDETAVLPDGTPSACTNYKRIMIHPVFLDTLSDPELLFVMGHENSHPMLSHNFRRGARDPWAWNVAGDIVINKLLVEGNIGTMPQGCLYDIDLWNRGGGTTNGIYDLLPKGGGGGGEEGDGPGGGFKQWDVCEDAEGDASELAEAEADCKVKVAQAAQAARIMGKMSAGLELFVDELLQPKVKWEEVLERFVIRMKNESRSYARFNRRFLPQGMLLPSQDGTALGPLVIACDCSGSCVGDLPQFGAEVITVHQDHRPVELHVLYFDTEVSHHDEFTMDDSPHFEPHGGGGTLFSPIFEYVRDNGIDPVACVVLTDLCSSDFGPEPDYPVLWVSNHSEEAPWGEVVKM